MGHQNHRRTLPRLGRRHWRNADADLFKKLQRTVAIGFVCNGSHDAIVATAGCDRRKGCGARSQSCVVETYAPQLFKLSLRDSHGEGAIVTADVILERVHEE